MSLNFLNAANVDKVDNKEFKTLKCLTSLGISVLSGNEDVDRWNLICNSFVTEDPQLKEEKSLARSLSGYIKRNTPVLITGPTGTGKEILAKIIHGPRPQDKFYAVNCGGLVDNLFESQLFGHVRGAFTGAASDKKGYLQAASAFKAASLIDNSSLKLQGNTSG
jgi:transcriptional regulator with PAS, ATPase and Fis domain